MGKRSSFRRRTNDAYDTPARAALPLLARLPERFTYVEPCAGAGQLIEALPGRCSYACDIAPRADRIVARDALTIDRRTVRTADYIITNPPWTRALLHPLIEHLAGLRPTWLLLDADYAHIQEAARYLVYCWEIVSVGRVRWIPGSRYDSKDNAAWFLFDRTCVRPTAGPIFFAKTRPIILPEPGK